MIDFICEPFYYWDQLWHSRLGFAYVPHSFNFLITSKGKFTVLYSPLIISFKNAILFKSWIAYLIAEYQITAYCLVFVSLYLMTLGSYSEFCAVYAQYRQKWFLSSKNQHYYGLKLFPLYLVKSIYVFLFTFMCQHATPVQ